MAPEPIVYVVDDDQSVRRALRRMLTSAGWQVQTYGSGVDFLKAFDVTQPGCIVLDIRMPEMSGLEVQTELAARGNSMPIILITAFEDPLISEQAMQAGVVALLEKPVKNQLLLSHVEQAVDANTSVRQTSNLCPDAPADTSHTTEPTDSEGRNGL